MSAEFHDFGISQNGEIVHRVVLRSPSLEVSVLTRGAVLHFNANADRIHIFDTSTEARI